MLDGLSNEIVWYSQRARVSKAKKSRRQRCCFCCCCSFFIFYLFMFIVFKLAGRLLPQAPLCCFLYCILFPRQLKFKFADPNCVACGTLDKIIYGNFANDHKCYSGVHLNCGRESYIFYVTVFKVSELYILINSERILRLSRL